MNNKKKCFVIMPFSTTKSCTKNKWTEIFEYIIKQAVEESGLGYECERSVAGRENIIKSILDALNKASVVIADLTDNNPNVFYELGVRHTLANRTILVAQDEKHVPFDLKPYPVAFYSESPAKIAEFKKNIKKKLEDIETSPERSDNPVADFLKERNIELLSSEKKANLRKLTAFISELSNELSDMDTMVKQLKQVQKKRVKTKKDQWALNTRFCNACLEQLLTNQYVLLPPDLLKFINLLNSKIRIVNKNLDIMQEFGEEVEKDLLEHLPDLGKDLRYSIRALNKVRIDYANDNYIEPEAPTIILSSPKHQKYLEDNKVA